MEFQAETIAKANGVLEDIAAEIGYTATNALVDWFGGGNLYIPATAYPDHAIAQVIGMAAMRRLVKLYEGKTGNARNLWLNQGYERELARRDRMIAALYALGLGTKQIMGIANMSERHVQQVRTRVESLGLLPLILRSAGIQENAAEQA
jgi:hypothetical protein